MPFKPGRALVEPDYDRLLGTLNHSTVRKNDVALYEVVKQLINWNRQSKNFTAAELQRIDGEIAGIITDGEDAGDFAPDDASYITGDSEIADLPNSLQLIAGAGITFDTSTPNELEINATGAFYDSPLTDGDLDETDLIFANGDCIIVQVPV